MGATFYSAYNSPQTYEQEKKEIERIYSNGDRNEILQTSKVGRIWYLAVKVIDSGEVFAGVCITYRSKGEWGYKSMTEHSWPYYYDAPQSLLNKLTVTDSEDALKWRQLCRDVLAQKADKKLFKPAAGMKFSVDGLFGKWHGVDIKTLICEDAQNRRYHCPEVNMTFTLKHKQVSELSTRVA